MVIIEYYNLLYIIDLLAYFIISYYHLNNNSWYVQKCKQL